MASILLTAAGTALGGIATFWQGELHAQPTPAAPIIRSALPQGGLRVAAPEIERVQRRFPGFVFLGAAPRYDGSDQAYLEACADLALRTAAPMVAIGDVLLRTPDGQEDHHLASARQTMVNVDLAERRPVPISDAMRTRIEAFEAVDPA